ncbi:BBE domain-containing protein [Rothia sp. AR01]|uniref:BBE domain-containing protein n=1 Tax=Rothia santali TaxID=2949643 RepID=A0A9X2KHF8_9MICC|nr:BBE domain-containing protein [Rothia santali]MCP3424734.1 BBE domain-containing protein [Rothia santali]
MYKTAGVTLPGGSCYSVGAGGHICGGGYGLLSRMHGLTTDHLAGVDVVLVPDGRNPVLAHASPQLNPELFRLCRGAGGGTVGIITAYYFDRLPAPPRDAVLLFLTVPWAQFLGAGGRERFAAWLGRYGEHSRRIQDDPRSDGLFTLLHVTHRSADMALTVQFCAREDDLPPGRNVATEADRVLRHLLDAVFLAPGAEGAVEYELASTSFGVGHAIVSEPATVSSRAYDRDLKVPGAVVMNWLDAVQYLDGSGANQRGKYKSAYLKDVPAAYAEGLYDALTSPPEELLGDELPEEGLPEGFDTTSLIVQMDSYGGTINRWANDADAVWQRDSQVKVQYQVYWHDPEQDPLYLAWLRKVYAAGFGGSAGPGLPWDPEGAHYQGCYINYPDVDMLEAASGGAGGAGGEASDGGAGAPADPATPASWLELYFGPALPARLVAAKAAYDPHDVFRHAMSIPTREPGR